MVIHFSHATRPSTTPLAGPSVASSLGLAPLWGKKKKKVLTESFISDGILDQCRFGSSLADEREGKAICACLYLDAGEHGVPPPANQSGGQ